MAPDSPLQVLVIDDDAVDRLAVQRALRGSALSVQLTEADSAEAGLAAATSRRFDCILLDFRMPRRDGMEVLLALRGHEANRRTPVIMLTGHGDEQLAVVLMKAGASDYLVKSALSTERLEQSIRHVVRVGQAQAEADRARQSLERYTAQLQGLAAASLQASARLEPVVLMRSFAERARTLFGARMAAVSVRDPDRASEVLHVIADAAAPTRRTPSDGLGSLLAGFVAPTVRLTAELSRDGLQTLLEAAGLALPEHRWMGVAITSPGEEPSESRCGLLHLFDPDVDASSATDRVVVAQLAQILGVAMDNARLFRRASAAIRLRDEVMGVVSHDLRNPLQVVSMASTVLAADATERQRGQLRKIQRAVEQSTRLIQDLLDVTRLESGGLSLELAPVALGPLISEATDQLRPIAGELGLTLVADVSAPSSAVEVDVDAARVAQVLTNLVGNAFKFTPRGGTVTVAAVAHADGVHVTVSDTGSGIRPEHLPHVFDRFWQADTDRKRGAGLGLAIVQGIVTSHHGRVWVESTLGQGTIVTFTLPRAQSPANHSRG